MTPSAEPAAPAADAIVPPKILEGGEVVILAIKPSGWSVALHSWPVLLAAAVVPGAALAVKLAMDIVVPQQLLVLICCAAALLRVGVAGFQWLGHLYVLTNRRVLRIRGVLRADLLACPLQKIRKTSLAADTAQRLVAVGSLVFAAGQEQMPAMVWRHIARPDEVLQVVNDAIRRAR